jgi:hypothetical protein
MKLLLKAHDYLHSSPFFQLAHCVGFPYAQIYKLGQPQKVPKNNGVSPDQSERSDNEECTMTYWNTPFGGFHFWLL